MFGSGPINLSPTSCLNPRCDELRQEQHRADQSDDEDDCQVNREARHLSAARDSRAMTTPSADGSNRSRFYAEHRRWISGCSRIMKGGLPCQSFLRTERSAIRRASSVG